MWEGAVEFGPNSLGGGLELVDILFVPNMGTGLEVAFVVPGTPKHSARSKCLASNFHRPLIRDYKLR